MKINMKAHIKIQINSMDNNKKVFI